jgi:hypothetical protein
VADYHELGATGLDADFARHYRVYGDDANRVQACLGTGLIRQVLSSPGTYVELRDSALLVFRPERGLEPTEAVEDLLTHAEQIMAQLVHPPK